MEFVRQKQWLSKTFILCNISCAQGTRRVALLTCCEIWVLLQSFFWTGTWTAWGNRSVQLWTLQHALLLFHIKGIRSEALSFGCSPSTCFAPKLLVVIATGLLKLVNKFPIWSIENLKTSPLILPVWDFVHKIYVSFILLRQTGTPLSGTGMDCNQ